MNVVLDMEIISSRELEGSYHFLPIYFSPKNSTQLKGISAFFGVRSTRTNQEGAKTYVIYLKATMLEESE